MLLQRVLRQARSTILARHVSPLLLRQDIRSALRVLRYLRRNLLSLKRFEMYEQIQWTTFGIPYVVEFNNVSFAPRRTTSPSQDTCMTAPTLEGFTSISQQSMSYSCSSATSSTSSFCHVSHCMLDSSLESRSSISRLVSLSRSATMRSASSFFKRKHQKRAGTCTPPRPTKSFGNSIDTWCSIPPHVPKPLPPLPQHEAEGIHMDGLYIQFATPPCHPCASSRSRLASLQKTITSAVIEAGMDTPSALEEHMGYSDRASSIAPDHRGRDSLFRGTYGQVMVALKAAGLVATPCMEGEFAGATRLGALFVAHRTSEARSVQLRKLTLWG